MYIDISSNQGKINWAEVKNNNIKGVILRGTTKNNKLDVRTLENYNGILHNMPELEELSIYKFAYARNYIDARIECRKCLQALSEKAIHFDYFYIDIEGHSGRDYTKDEANEVILGYHDEMTSWGLDHLFRLYFNYNYLKNIIDKCWFDIPIWLARYNSEIGDTLGANIVLWQYTSKGSLGGIDTNVDLNRRLNNDNINRQISSKYTV